MKLSSALLLTKGEARQSPDVIARVVENLASSSLSVKLPAAVIQLLEETNSRCVGSLLASWGISEHSSCNDVVSQGAVLQQMYPDWSM